MRSYSSKILEFFLNVLFFKYIVSITLKHPKRANQLHFSTKLLNKFQVSQFKIMNKSVITVQSKVCVSNIHIVFFHGGSYVIEGNSMHWRIIETFVSKLNCKVSYIDYPLAPENNYVTTFKMVYLSYIELINKYSDDKFILMGDSAGGGLALAFAQKLKYENFSVQPQKIILFSPWLDLTMKNPTIKQQEKFDKILPLKGLINAGLKYAGGDDRTYYLLSPINGKFEGLCDTLVFYGTYELFYPDCKKLQEKTKTFGNFIFKEFPKMQHDWVIFPIPESIQALNITIDFIRN